MAPRSPAMLRALRFALVLPSLPLLAGAEAAAGETPTERGPVVASGDSAAAGGSGAAPADGAGSGSALPAVDTASMFDRDCLVNGFWEVSEDIVVRFLRTERRTGFLGHRVWNATFYPRAGSWHYGESEPRQCTLDLESGGATPNLYPRCSSAPSGASPPFASPCPVYWGVVQNILWGSPPASVTDFAWTAPPQSAAWDPTPPQCSTAMGVDHLEGQLQWLNGGIWGIGGCENKQFKRLSPETAALDAAGWQQVADYGWSFGVELFLRRLAAARRWAITSEAGFLRFAQVRAGHVVAGRAPTFAAVVADMEGAQWHSR